MKRQESYSIRQKISEWTPAIAFLIALFLILQVTVELLRIPSFILPEPSAVFANLLFNFQSFIPHILVTLQEIVLGYVVGVFSGFILGMLIVYSEKFRFAFYPYIMALQVLPKAALAPLILLWLGTTLLGRVTVTALILLFAVMINTIVGLTNVKPELFELVRIYDTPKRLEFAKIRIPNTLPFLFSSLKFGVTLTATGAVISEFLGGDAGLGYLISTSADYLLTVKIFSSLAILILISLSLFSLIVRVERKVIFWKS